MTAVDSAARVASSAGGQVLRVATRVVALRPAAKPLHPGGAVVEASLHRFGAAERTGIPWLDEGGDDRGALRLSRAVGLPAPAPDVFGLALRVPVDAGGYGDLLFASTGLGRLTRFTLTAGLSPGGRPMTTLLPYRTPVGPLVLSAVLHGGETVSLAWAVGAGTWHRFA